MKLKVSTYLEEEEFSSPFSWTPHQGLATALQVADESNGTPSTTDPCSWPTDSPPAA